jgi:hypothetical protein
MLGSAGATVSEIKRGIPSETDEVICHKPLPPAIMRTASAV